MPSQRYNLRKYKPYFPKNYNYSLIDFYSACPFTENELLEKTRKREICQWRQILSFFYYANGNTFEKIAEILKQDHSTVIYSNKVVLNALQGNDKMVKDKIESILEIREIIFKPTFDICVNEMNCLRYLEQNIKHKLEKL